VYILIGYTHIGTVVISQYFQVSIFFGKHGTSHPFMHSGQNHYIITNKKSALQFIDGYLYHGRLHVRLGMERGRQYRTVVKLDVGQSVYFVTAIDTISGSPCKGTTCFPCTTTFLLILSYSFLSPCDHFQPPAISFDLARSFADHRRPSQKAA
jgi:hypothetical protein